MSNYIPHVRKMSLDEALLVEEQNLVDVRDRQSHNASCTYIGPTSPRMLENDISWEQRLKDAGWTQLQAE